MGDKSNKQNLRPLVDEIDKHMKCSKCGKLKAVYADGIACMEQCEGVTQFAAIKVEKRKRGDKEVIQLCDGRQVAAKIRGRYPNQVVGDYGYKRPEQHTKVVLGKPPLY